MTYAEFIKAYQDGSLYKDAAWRAYDIPQVVERKNRRFQGLLVSALKQLGLNPRDFSGSLGYVKNMYGLATPGMARDTLIMWRIFINLQSGVRMLGLPLRSEINVRD